MKKNGKGKLKSLINRLRSIALPPFLRNRYFLTSAIFLFWMTFFDQRSIIQQVQLRYKIFEQNEKIEYYSDEIKKVNKERQALFGDPMALERFARERYKMVKDGEDLYLFIEK